MTKVQRFKKPLIGASLHESHTSSEVLLAELFALILSASASAAAAGGFLLSLLSRALIRHSPIISNWCSTLAK